jgi:hypothetical protein
MTPITHIQPAPMEDLLIIELDERHELTLSVVDAAELNIACNGKSCTQNLIC